MNFLELDKDEKTKIVNNIFKIINIMFLENGMNKPELFKDNRNEFRLFLKCELEYLDDITIDDAYAILNNFKDGIRELKLDINDIYIDVINSLSGPINDHIESKKLLEHFNDKHALMNHCLTQIYIKLKNDYNDIYNFIIENDLNISYSISTVKHKI